MNASSGKVIALAGGVGGAKLADGLAQVLREKLTVVVNTGDDFEHLGLRISPDLDTVMYTLAGLANPIQGWGLQGESWAFMEQVARLGGPEWFRLGDRDLATHAIRTSRLNGGATLTAVTAELCRSLGIVARILPMSDEPVRTVIRSGDDLFSFQDYFVRLRCEVPVSEISYEGSTSARFNRELVGIGAADRPAAVIFCPSNPYLSIDPILAIPGVRDWLRALQVPVVAVSPIVGGTAIKGPAAKIMLELGGPVSVTTIAEHYRGLISGIVIDEIDAQLQDQIEATGAAVRVAPTIMRSTADRVSLAETCLAFADDLGRRLLSRSGN
ncbi:2-phospho-L-lactate transferase [Bradyrhizobium canariense]|uniref:LPPG:FO 2-phospho-L-lactate transferase n=1 Tax=Bradyrhizobium canariense TaxID=255045 RepID=A0A1H1XRA3_9BRAD|nr:2-phospho-L-lactate transferase [Bradyrhizobium canariense]SDT11369.1 LPPG:FO 2-phospho-L-lactate transferase [Bradyrhizobium canariense]